MLIKDIIASFRLTRQGTDVSDEQLVEWLSVCEGHLYDDILCHYDGYTEYVPFNINTANVMNKSLYADKPYADVYLYYLQGMVDYNNSDSARFMNSMTMYNTALQSFGDAINRKNQAKYVGIKV